MNKQTLIIASLLIFTHVCQSQCKEFNGDNIQITPQPELVARLHNSKHAIIGLRYSSTGKRLATIDSEKTIRVWDINRGVEVCSIHRPARTYSTSLAFSPDDRILAFVNRYNVLTFYECITGRSMCEIKWGPTKSIASFAVSKGFAKLAVIGGDKSKPGEELLCIYDLQWNDRQVSLKVSQCLIVKFSELKIDKDKFVFFPERRMLAFSPDSEVLALAACDNIYLIKTRAGVLNKILRSGDARLTSYLVFSPSGRFIVSSSSDAFANMARPSKITIWSVRSVESLWSVSLKNSLNILLDYSPDGRVFISSGDDGFLRLWEVASGKEIQNWSYNAHDTISSVSFKPDGKAVAAAMPDGTVLIWDLKPFGWDHPRRKLTSKSLRKLWTDLAGDDIGAAYKAVYTFASARDDATNFFREKLHPIPVETLEQIARLIADLDNDSFRVRESATKSLARLGIQAEDALRKVLADSPSAEARRRAQHLLNSLPGWLIKDPENLRTIRAIWVLQRIGTPPARTLLENLATGASAERQTQEAKAAVQYLDRMKK